MQHFLIIPYDTSMGGKVVAEGKLTGFQGLIMKIDELDWRLTAIEIASQQKM